MNGLYVSSNIKLSIHVINVQSKFLFQDGRNYTGHFLHSMLHGDGKISYKNGTIVDGEFIHGVPCGRLSKNFQNKFID